MEKYKLLSKRPDGLHQIQALRDFADVKAGDLGEFTDFKEYSELWRLAKAIAKTVA